MLHPQLEVLVSLVPGGAAGGDVVAVAGGLPSGKLHHPCKLSCRGGRPCAALRRGGSPVSRASASPFVSSPESASWCSRTILIRSLGVLFLHKIFASTPEFFSVAAPLSSTCDITSFPEIFTSPVAFFFPLRGKGSINSAVLSAPAFSTHHVIIS